jgi:anaerobic selenocysteine-containing dehydrogenase
MTNGWVDIKNTDMMLIMGGNPAENHPCGFKWPIEAKLHRNAKMIVVDPRFTRTAANADLFLQIRAGSDIAFLGGLINYAIANKRLAHDYLVNYTNASFLIHQGFKLPEDGLYSGFDPESHLYDMTTWNYEAGGLQTAQQVAGAATGTASGGGGSAPSTVAPHTPSGAPASVHFSQPLTGLGYAAQGPSGAKAGGSASAPGGSARPTPPSLPPNVAYDPSLQHPRCVFQLLKQQYSRYTPEMVERITGIPRDQFLKAADLFTSVRTNGDMK